MAHFYLIELLKVIKMSVQGYSCSVTNFVGGWGSAPDPDGGAQEAPPDPLVGFSALRAVHLQMHFLTFSDLDDFCLFQSLATSSAIVIVWLVVTSTSYQYFVDSTLQRIII